MALPSTITVTGSSASMMVQWPPRCLGSLSLQQPSLFSLEALGWSSRNSGSSDMSQTVPLSMGPRPNGAGLRRNSGLRAFPGTVARFLTLEARSGRGGWTRCSLGSLKSLCAGGTAGVCFTEEASICSSEMSCSRADFSLLLNTLKARWLNSCCGVKVVQVG